MRRVTAAGALLLMMALPEPAGAESRRATRGWSDDGSVGAAAVSVNLSSGGGGSVAGTRSGRSTCSATNGDGAVSYKPYADPRYGNNAAEEDSTGQPGRWMVRYCGGNYDDTVWWPQRQGQPIDPADLAREAFESVALPTPVIRMNPGGNAEHPQLVNLPTFLWIDLASRGERRASATAEGVTSTVTARAMRVIWSFGNGDSITCEGLGRAYVPGLPDEAQPSDCRYTYRRSSAGLANEAYTVTATVEWAASWSAVGAPGGGTLPAVRRSGSAPARVAEIQAINTRPRA